MNKIYCKCKHPYYDEDEEGICYDCKVKPPPIPDPPRNEKLHVVGRPVIFKDE